MQLWLFCARIQPSRTIWRREMGLMDEKEKTKNFMTLLCLVVLTVRGRKQLLHVCHRILMIPVNKTFFCLFISVCSDMFNTLKLLQQTQLLLRACLRLWLLRLMLLWCYSVSTQTQVTSTTMYFQLNVWQQYLY